MRSILFRVASIGDTPSWIADQDVIAVATAGNGTFVLTSEPEFTFQEFVTPADSGVSEVTAIFSFIPIMEFLIPKGVQLYCSMYPGQIGVAQLMVRNVLPSSA